jgi:hypothetical protein
LATTISAFHNIFCASGAPLTRSQIAGWAVELWYGDQRPMFEPAPDDAETWDGFTMRVPGVGRPIVFRNDVDPERVGWYVAEAIEEAPIVLPPAVLAQLKGARRVIGIELAPDLLTEDAWELLDALQSCVATRLDGLLVTHDGVYDARLRPLHEANGSRSF